MTDKSNLLNDLFFQDDRKIEISKNKKDFYVDNDELHNEVIRCKSNDTCSTKLAEMFQKLAYRVSFMPAFKYYNDSDRKDCVQHAVYRMIEQYREFDTDRGTNAFSFFTQTALNGLRAGWNIIKKNSKDTVRFDMIFDESI